MGIWSSKTVFPVALFVAFPLCVIILAAAAAQPESEAIDRKKAKELKNPFPYTRQSLARGKNLYLRGTCQECHDMDGTARLGSDLAEAADLTDPRSWQFGTSDGEIFADIRDGTPGQMPGFKDKLKDDQIWHLVNYIRGIGPKAMRPPFVEAAEVKPETEPKESEAIDPKKLKNPLAYTRASIAKGKNVYIRATCQECHDLDGTARVGSDLAEAADLTDPRSWKFGTTEGEVFIHIRDGTGEQMPGFKEKLKDEQIWNLVNYIRSLGPKAMRPKLVKEEG